MIIWGALILPFLTAWALSYWYAHRTTWWEYALPLMVSSLLILSMKAGVESSLVTSEEYWGSAVQTAEHYEDWNEYIQQTCSETCCCDKDGNNCSTRSYDCSYVQYHGEYWQLRSTTEEVVRISAKAYAYFVARFGNEQFTDLHRAYHTNDGDMYSATWPGDSLTLEPVTTLHYYENRVKAADASIFHFQPISDRQADSLGLFHYPHIVDGYQQTVLLGDSSPDALLANDRLAYWNAKLGRTKQVRIYVLLFHDQPRSTGTMQEWAWCGANMNELVVAIGIDKHRRLQWCHPFSWTRRPMLLAAVRQYVERQDTLQLAKFASWLGPVMRDHFERRDFAEFDYLTVEPPTWAVWLTYALTALLCFGLAAFAVKNDVDPK